MGDTVKRRGQWWAEGSDGSWMRWTGEEWEPAANPPPPPGRGARLYELSKGLGLPAFILAVTTLALTVVPSWLPVTERAVIIKDTSISRGVEFRDYIRYPSVRDSLLEKVKRADAESADKGIVVDFNYELRGFSKETFLPLRWTLFSKDGERIRESEDVDPLFKNFGGANFNADLQGSDVGSWGIWIEADLDPGRYFLRIELYNQPGIKRLAYKDSQIFKVT